MGAFSTIDGLHIILTIIESFPQVYLCKIAKGLYVLSLCRVSKTKVIHPHTVQNWYSYGCFHSKTKLRE